MDDSRISAVINPCRPVGLICRCGSLGRSAVCWIALLCVLTSTQVFSQEPVLEFVEGLRQRQYFDTALEYLDFAQLQPGLSADVRDVIDLERAKTLQAMGSTSRVPEDRELYLQRAKNSLQKFTTEHMDHPQSAFANSMLGELLLERARTLIWQMEGTESPAEKLEYQQAARKLIDEGQAIYQIANDKYKAAFDAFPNFIDRTKDEEQYDARQDVEAKYLRAWFNLIRCTYERGQTFDRGSEERKTTLIAAAGLYEALHTKYRTNQIGLHARLMMGKCFQEQDDLGRALGIYKEMLDHKSESDAVEQLKGIALHYRLICLNDPERHDHQLVMNEATIWLQANKNKGSQPYSLGILWERAIAGEKLGESREIDEKNRNSALESALQDATQVGRYQGPYREPANAMTRRIKVALGVKDKEPKDFATAFERARNMIAQIQALTDDVANAEDDTARTLKKAALESHLKQVAAMLQLAQDLRDSDSDPKAVAQSRYLQSFVMLKLGRPLDSMILARHCMVQDRAADPDTALNATEIAMAAAVSAWNMAPSRDRDFETRALKDVCQKILELFPQSSRGGEARMRLGSVYRTMNQPLDAAKWFMEVPETDPQYASARISAGQSYWTAWTQQAAAAVEHPDDPQTPAADMQALKTQARDLLIQGIKVTRDKIGADAKPSDEVVAAEVSLASITNLDGDFQGTITRLTSGDANSVVAAIEMPEGTERPADGIQSNSFAGLTYRLLLRAYVGTQQIDQALGVMTKLENVGGQNILAVYTQLGLELQEELQRLKLAGDTERLNQTRESFEKFLQKVYESRNKSDYNSLLWIGETYFGLGQGVAGDPTAAADYYAKAANAYNEIISGGLAAESNRTVVQLRLARCLRQQKKYDEAFRMCDEILKSNPNALDAQFEVAHVLSDWGAESEPAKLLEAIQGIRAPDGKAGYIWGWSLMTRKLEQTLQKSPTPEMKERFLDARYQLTNSRRRYAKTDAPESEKQLQAGLAEVISFAQRYQDLDDATFARFDRLYQDMQTDLGKPPMPLERKSITGNATGDQNVVELVEEELVAANDSVAAVQPKPEESRLNPVLLGILIALLSLGIAGGFFFFMRRPGKRVRVPGTEKTPKFAAISTASEVPHFTGVPDEPVTGPDFSGVAVAAPRRTGASRSATAAGAVPSKASRPASGDRSGTGGAPRTRPAPAAGTGDSAVPPKPRPRPAASAGGATPSETQPPAARPAGERPVAPRPPSQQQPPSTKPPVAKPPEAGQPPRPQRKPQTPPDKTE